MRKSLRLRVICLRAQGDLSGPYLHEEYSFFAMIKLIGHQKRQLLLIFSCFPPKVLLTCSTLERRLLLEGPSYPPKPQHEKGY